MVYRLLTLVLLSTLALKGYSQASDSVIHSGKDQGTDYLSLLVGYTGFKNHFLELGVARNSMNRVGYHSAGLTYFFSTEARINDKFVVGPKIGFWFGGGLAIGMNLIYYSDFDKGALRFRPEIGFGIDRFKMVYGYSAAITNKDFAGVNSHMFSFVFLLQLKNLE